MSAGLHKIFFVYITCSAPRGVLYVGMTSNLPGRAWEHRERVFDGFTKKYWAGRLVYYEFHETGEGASRRERSMKRWRRDWKIELIQKANPTWADLYDQALMDHGLDPLI